MKKINTLLVVFVFLCLNLFAASPSSQEVTNIADARALRALGRTNSIVGGTITATNFSGSGTGLTDVPATSLTGTLPDARLSTNVPLMTLDNVFGGTQAMPNTNNTVSGTFTGPLNGNATTATTAASLAAFDRNVSIAIPGVQTLQLWIYEDFNSNYIYGPFGDGVAFASKHFTAGWKSYVGTNFFMNGEYLPNLGGASRSDICIQTNLPYAGTNAAGSALLVYGRVSSAANFQTTQGGLMFGFTTNGSQNAVKLGARYNELSGLNIAYGPAVASAPNMPDWFLPDVEMGCLVRILTNGYTLKMQGGFFDEQGCTLGSANWFEGYRYVTNSADWLTNMAAVVGAAFNSNGVVVSRIEIYTNWVDSESASLIDCQIDQHRVPHAGDILRDNNGNLVAEWETAGPGGDGGTNVIVQVALRGQNGIWTPPVVVGGPSMNEINSATNAGRLSLLNGQLIAQFMHTSGRNPSVGWVTNWLMSYKAVNITNETITLGAEQVFNVTNMSVVQAAMTNGATNMLIQSRVVIAPDGAQGLCASMLDTNGVIKGAYYLRSLDGTNWCAYGLINTDTSASETDLFITSDGALGVVERYNGGHNEFQFSTNSGLTWSAGIAGPYPSTTQRPVAASLPDGRVLFFGGDSTNQRIQMVAWVCNVTASNNGVAVQYKIPIYSATNTDSVKYPSGIYHNGNLEMVWCEAMHANNNDSGVFHFNRQPFDRSLVNAAKNARQQSLARLDRQAYSLPGSINLTNTSGVLPVLAGAWTTNIAIVGIGTLHFTNGTLINVTP